MKQLNFVILLTTKIIWVFGEGTWTNINSFAVKWALSTSGSNVLNVRRRLVGSIMCLKLAPNVIFQKIPHIL